MNRGAGACKAGVWGYLAVTNTAPPVMMAFVPIVGQPYASPRLNASDQARRLTVLVESAIIQCGPATRCAVLGTPPYRPGSDKPARSSSHAIALIFQPVGVLMNCVEIIPRVENITPFVVPDLA